MIEHLSYSSISTYLLCPRSWKYRYLDKVKTPTAANLIFGSAVHHAIEEYVITNTAGNVVQYPAEIFAADWPERVAREGNISWGDDDATKMGAMGAALLRAALPTIDTLRPLLYHDRLAIEEKVFLKVPGVPLPVVGYIDIITQDGVAGDFKTSSRKWDAGKAAQETQPLFYLAALNQAGFDLNPEHKFRHYVLVKTKTPAVQVIETAYSLADILRNLEQIREVYQAITKNVFPCNTSTWKCSVKWCEYWSMCQGA